MSDGPDNGGSAPNLGSRAGSFELIEAAGRWGGQTRFFARGATGTAHAGLAALVVTAPIAGESAALRQAAVARLDAIVAFRHERVLPAVEAGVWDDGLYLAHPLPGNPTLADRLSRGEATEANAALAVVDGLAAALDAAAAMGVPHGDVRPVNVWLADDGGPLLGGFVLATGGDPRADASGLAFLLASLLIGREVSAVPGDDLGSPPSWHRPAGLPGMVWESVERGFLPAAAGRYPTSGALVTAFREALAGAVAAQVAGVWEALALRDYAMAMLLCESALRLRPHDPDVVLLLQQVRANASGTTGMAPLDLGLLGPSPASPPVARADPAVATPVGPPRAAAAMPGLDALPTELTRILSVTSPPSRSSNTAWVTLATGLVFLVSMTLLAAFVAMSYR